MANHPKNDQLEFRDDGFVYLKNVCVGAVHAENGKIIEITIDIEQNNISRVELLEFLALLKMKYDLNLSQISIIDNPKGLAKNAGEYLESHGYCLPQDLGKYFLELALESEKTGCAKECKDQLDCAIEHGSELALLKKAIWILENERVFPGIPKNERIRQCTDMMVNLACRTANPAVLAEAKQFWANKLAKAEASHTAAAKRHQPSVTASPEKRERRQANRMFTPPRTPPHSEPHKTAQSLGTGKKQNGRG